MNELLYYSLTAWSGGRGFGSELVGPGGKVVDGWVQWAGGSGFVPCRAGPCCCGVLCYTRTGAVNVTVSREIDRWISIEPAQSHFCATGLSRLVPNFPYHATTLLQVTEAVT